jgi:hypothetical protein
VVLLVKNGAPVLAFSAAIHKRLGHDDRAAETDGHDADQRHDVAERRTEAVVAIAEELSKHGGKHGRRLSWLSRDSCVRDSLKIFSLMSVSVSRRIREIGLRRRLAPTRARSWSACSRARRS